MLRQNQGRFARSRSFLVMNSYLFILRLIPAFPFFIVNIVPALFDVRLRNYVISTALGIIPGSLVYASVGAGVGAIFDAGGDVQLSGLMLQPAVIGPILGLIALSSLPILYKKFKGAPAKA
ncbi:MAG: VTT domain-containing protein [Pseudomonadota bacterium]